MNITLRSGTAPSLFFCVFASLPAGCEQGFQTRRSEKFVDRCSRPSFICLAGEDKFKNRYHRQFLLSFLDISRSLSAGFVPTPQPTSRTNSPGVISARCMVASPSGWICASPLLELHLAGSGVVIPIGSLFLVRLPCCHVSSVALPVVPSLTCPPIVLAA